MNHDKKRAHSGNLNSKLALLLAGDLDSLLQSSHLCAEPQQLAIWGYHLPSAAGLCRGLRLLLFERTKIDAAKVAPPIGKYWFLRLKSIFLPYLLAVIIYYLYFVRHGYFSFSLTDLAGYVIRGNLASPFYFVIALAQFILLAGLFRWLARRWTPVVLLPIALGITLLSNQYLNSILTLISPGLSFPYGDRLFTTFLVYYLAGCCAGQSYHRFLVLLRRNRPLLYLCALLFAGADALCTWQLFVLQRNVPFCELVHLLFQLTAIPALYALAVQFPLRLPPLLQRMDKATFLIYLYHSLILVWFNDLMYRLGVQKTYVQFILRVLVVYLLSFLLCMLWQWAFYQLKRALHTALLHFD